MSQQFRVFTNLPDIDRRQRPTRSDRWRRGFSRLRWTPLHLAADARKMEVLKILIPEDMKLNELTKAV
jgi:hypothetical protein